MLIELYSFLENFNTDTDIVLVNSAGIPIYAGKVGGITQYILNERCVVKGSVKIFGSYISITVTDRE